MDPAGVPVPADAQADERVEGALVDAVVSVGLAEVRAAPRLSRPPHLGEHSVLQCLHVLLNEEWEHHRYTVRDLDVLDPAEAPGS